MTTSSLESEQDSVIALWQRAHKLIEDNKYQQAFTLIQQAEVLADTASDLCYYCADIYITLNKNDDARRCLEKAEAMLDDRNKKSSYCMVANGYIQITDYYHAQRLLSLAVTHRNVDHIDKCILNFITQGQHAYASKWLGEAVDFTSDYQGWSDLGECAKELGDNYILKQCLIMVEQYAESYIEKTKCALSYIEVAEYGRALCLITQAKDIAQDDMERSYCDSLLQKLKL